VHRGRIPHASQLGLLFPALSSFNFLLDSERLRHPSKLLEYSTVPLEDFPVDFSVLGSYLAVEVAILHLELQVVGDSKGLN